MCADGSGIAIFEYDNFSACLTYSKTGQSITPAIKAEKFIEKVVSNMGIECKIVVVEKTDDGISLR